MIGFLVRRLLGAMASLFVAVTLVFFALSLTPGDPAEAALSQSTATEDMIERRRVAMGLDQPLMVQYQVYMMHLLRGDLGISWSAGQSVNLLISQQLGATLRLASVSMIIALSVGGCLGLLSAAYTHGKVGSLLRGLTGLIIAFPVMFSAMLLIWLFSVKFHFDGELILPAMVLGVSVGASVARVVDAGITEILGQPFLQVARAKGLSRFQVMIHHALPVGILPALDVTALQFGFLVGGTVVIESVFARQGLGRLLLNAVLDKDLPIIQGVVVVTALGYSILNIIADMIRAWLDPRIRLGE